MAKYKQKKAISAAERQRRSQQAEQRKIMAGNAMWDTCEGLYQECAGLLSTIGAVNSILSIPGLLAEVKDPVGLDENLGLLIKDSLDLSGRLTALHEQHADRRGSAKDANDFTMALAIQEQYIQFTEVFRLSIQPVLNVVMEHTAAAELALVETQQRTAAAQDPIHTDPIDVPFKDVPVETAQGQTNTASAPSQAA